MAGQGFIDSHEGNNHEVFDTDLVSPMEVYPGASVVVIGDDPSRMDIMGDKLVAIGEISSKDIMFISEHPEELL